MASPAFFILFGYVLCCLLLFIIHWVRWKHTRRISVVVLGDIGVCPRMQYHSSSLVKSGYEVDIIGYSGSQPHSFITRECNICLHYMVLPPSFIKVFPSLLAYACKAIFQAMALFCALMVCQRPQILILQNPPSVPALPVCWLVCRLRKTRFIIDWHNYGYTMMALAVKRKKHPLVSITNRIEGVIGRWSDGGLCVSKAMQADLLKQFGVHAVVHYDRPPEIFLKADLEQQHELFMKLAQDYPMFKSKFPSHNSSSRTAFTVRAHDGHVAKLDGRPALLISSTSWSDDEDFSVLLSALDDYDVACEASLGSLPALVCVITGKGPLKQYYTGLIRTKEWSHIEVCTPWLEANDYPKILASADLGVCLHTSSSGLDLPMKVVDMFGVGLPVCAMAYQALPELVKHDKNGQVFHCARELAQQLQELLKGFPENCSKLAAFRRNLQNFERWHDRWRISVLPLCKIE